MTRGRLHSPLEKYLDTRWCNVVAAAAQNVHLLKVSLLSHQKRGIDVVDRDFTIAFVLALIFISSVDAYWTALFPTQEIFLTGDAVCIGNIETLESNVCSPGFFVQSARINKRLAAPWPQMLPFVKVFCVCLFFFLYVWKFSSLRFAEVKRIKLHSLFLSIFLLCSACQRPTDQGACRVKAPPSALSCHTLSSLSSSSVLEKRWHSRWCIMQDLCIVMAVLIYLFVAGVSPAHLWLQITNCVFRVCVPANQDLSGWQWPTLTPPPQPPSLHCSHAKIQWLSLAGPFKHFSH